VEARAVCTALSSCVVAVLRRGGSGRWLPFIVVAALLSAFSSPAAAEPWFEGHAEFGLVSGHFEFDKPYRTFEDLPAVAHDEGGPLGIAVGLGGIVGMRVRSKVGLGLAPRVEFAPYLENVRPRHASVSSHALTGVGPLLAFRPSPSLELRFSTEWVWATHHGSTHDILGDTLTFSSRGTLAGIGRCDV